MSTTGDPRGSAPTGVSAVLALVIGVVGFAALSILGLGMLTFFTDSDILTVPGVDWWPGIVGMVVAVGAFAWMLWPALAQDRAPFTAVIPVALVAAVVHLVAVGLGALLSGGGATAALSAASQLVTHGSSPVVLLAALVASWAAIALRRTGSRAPRWPWEDDSE
ncbi:hypothetical protein ACFWHT_12700 [Microbacterium sp. NPDC058342]|uniref:hypothetical protein n=1 Tax=Microbacterium sp. NPDC058342 TaxID=3346454 RepID=UPI0036586DCC